MKKLARLALCLPLALACLAGQAQDRRPVPPMPPLLRVPDARLPIELERVRVDAQVVGLAAQTRVEMEFRNPNDRVLEGELQFPLQPGQAVTGFALDINGDLRPAVPVEKARGRQVFDDVIRTRVDPALLESTGGNNYKLRVYPLPPRGTRRVVLEISETLATRREGRRELADYVLPLDFNMVARRLDLTLAVPQYRGATAYWGKLMPQRLGVQRESDGSALLSLARSGFQAREPLRIALPLDDREPLVHAQAFRDGQYFYAEVPLALQTQPRPAPRTVAIVWDASGSAARRDLGRELALLDRWFQSLRDVAVDLRVVRDVAEPVRRFNVASGDWSALRQHLRTLPQDGATRLDQMVVPAGADLALLFTDGLGNYGEGALPASAVPLYAVNSAVSSDPVRLRRVAEASGGEFIDLQQADAEQAARALRQVRTRLAAIDAEGATELVAESAYARSGRLAIAGRMTEPRATVLLQLQAPDGTRSTRRIPVALAATRTQASQGSNLAAYRWATLTLAALEADRERNRAAIQRLGTRFGLVTSGTSLIVLDFVADYVRYGIEPPASLRPAYEAMVAQRRDRDQAARGQHLERVVRRFREKQDWWNKDFPKDAPPPPPPVAQQDERQARGAALEQQQRSARESSARAMPAPMAPPAAAPAPAPLLRGSGAPQPQARADVAASKTAQPGAAEAAITLRRWTPDSPYVRRLRAAAPEAMYAIYLDERPGYTGSTAYFLDVADIFLERGQPELAHRILSNLAEMDLENRHILRILAYRLLQAKQVEAALPLLQRVLELSPDEPQSYRDLGLALDAAGQPQKAIAQLWEVVAKPWNDRFPDIELIALGELNAIVAKSAAADRPLDTAAIDPRLLRNLPLDLRVVLSWDADNTDIDLWVVDPNGERASYENTLTRQGGRMSRDFTGGYGPEEFALKHAKPGVYTVRAQFYGHNQQVVAPATTLMLRLSTGFGTAAQKDVDTVLRLSGAGQEVTIGTFEVKAEGTQGAARQ